MTEDEARERCAAMVPRETLALLERYVTLLIDATDRQNLVSKSSASSIWSRHILDSLQLSPQVAGRCVDIGSGAGLPGVVLAVAGFHVVMVEPRRRRGEFLCSVLHALPNLPARVHVSRVENLNERFDTITARAVAPLDRLFAMSIHLAGSDTRWVLPKGQSAQSELEVARRAWHGRFETVPSITDPSALIVIAEQLSPKPQI